MTETPSDRPDRQPEEANAPQFDVTTLLQRLRRKEGNWVEWGQTCQQLQKAGHSPQQIFEETGFEPIHQNQIIVATQVYHSILNADVSPEVRSRFEQSGSDTLYEFRILNQPDRAAAATLVVEKGIDSEGAHEVAKALKDFARMSKPPEGFTSHAGDVVACYYWKLARQQSDLQARSRLIAQALRFAYSATARKQVEQLLTDFTVTRSRSAPLLPFYRLESEDELPRILPVVGKLPLSVDDFKQVPMVEVEEPFGLVKFSGTGAWVAVPGWQVILNAEDPVTVLSSTDQLPTPPSGQLFEQPEEVLIVVDRAKREWDDNSYFLVNHQGQLELQWFEETPSLPLLGRVILVMRPKRVLDQDYTKDPWQMDE